jgi:hypothetical protein
MSSFSSVSTRITLGGPTVLLEPELYKDLLMMESQFECGAGLV